MSDKSIRLSETTCVWHCRLWILHEVDAAVLHLPRGRKVVEEEWEAQLGADWSPLSPLLKMIGNCFTDHITNLLFLNVTFLDCVLVIYIVLWTQAAGFTLRFVVTAETGFKKVPLFKISCDCDLVLNCEFSSSPPQCLFPFIAARVCTWGYKCVRSVKADTTDMSGCLYVMK